MDYRESMERDGYAVARGLLSATEIASLRQASLLHFRNRGQEANMGKFQPNAAIAAPGVAWAIAHPKILDLFRQILGSDEIVFTGNADMQINRFSGWHKDDGDGRYLGPGCYDHDDCRVVRAGIYFQDHATNRQGMTVRVGSHRTGSLTSGDIRYVPTEPGDVLFIDVRLTHCGQLPDPLEKVLWGASSLFRCPSLGRRLKNLYWEAIGRQPKLSLFFACGLPNRFTHEFAQATMGCHAARAADARLRLPEPLVLSLQAQGVATSLPIRFDGGE